MATAQKLTRHNSKGETKMDISMAQKHIEEVNRMAAFLPGVAKLPGKRVSLTCGDLNLFVASWGDFRTARHYFDGRLKPEYRGKSLDGSLWFNYQLDGDLHLCINVNLASGDGATCRRVKVGEKVTPIYEIVCNGAEVESAN